MGKYSSKSCVLVYALKSIFNFKGKNLPIPDSKRWYLFTNKGKGNIICTYYVSDYGTITRTSVCKGSKLKSITNFIKKILKTSGMSLAN